MTTYERAMLMIAGAQLELLHKMARDRPLYEADNVLNEFAIRIWKECPAEAIVINAPIFESEPEKPTEEMKP